MDLDRSNRYENGVIKEAKEYQVPMQSGFAPAGNRKERRAAEKQARRLAKKQSVDTRFESGILIERPTEQLPPGEAQI